MFIIVGEHATAGAAEVRIGSTSYTTGGASLAHRARLVRPGFGDQWVTRSGAERALARVRVAVRGTAQWAGYVLRVSERSENNQAARPVPGGETVQPETDRHGLTYRDFLAQIMISLTDAERNGTPVPLSVLLARLADRYGLDTGADSPAVQAGLTARVKALGQELQAHYDDAKLIELYRLIHQLDAPHDRPQ